MPQNENSYKILTLIAHKLNVLITKQSIELEMLRHPDYPSLLTISDILNVWNISNEAFKVPEFTTKHLKKSAPCVICSKVEGFYLVEEVKSENIIINNGHQRSMISLDELKDKFQNVLLVLNKSKDFEEFDYKTKRQIEILKAIRQPFLVLSSILIFAIVAFLNISPSSERVALVFLMLKAAGLIVSVILLLQSINANNPIIQKLCGTDEKKNCQAILNSRAAKVTSFLTWSEIGFFYFSSTALTTICGMNNLRLIHFCAFANIVCIPYTLYSLFYQWRIAKQWCVLCCAVLVLLWLEFATALWSNSLTLQKLSVEDLTIIFLSILAPITFWSFSKHLLQQSMLVKPLKEQLGLFKRNTDVFHTLLSTEPAYAILPSEDSIVIGNPHAKNVITMVSNPFCKACSVTHRELEEVVEKNSTIQLQIVFVPRIYSRKNDSIVAAHLFSLKHNCSEALLKSSLFDWYNQEKKDYKKWAEKYPIQETKDLDRIVERQREWCGFVGIDTTPTIFFNGRRLSPVYHATDLAYIY
ncbi:hypothetical protein DYU05_00010 [Mucilaginibacter terrenus]|uniref:Peptidase C39 domain-containing protein n=1 Tax=Mucilaginibacter terrenus TaxID=2482727 RepID=A0A3E2NT16_9SPHI|nr:vitamin K epoxide reductase family protein [Mucilaginibacter terrenus]RFZ84061.1 hypothetical protein DYU05_00010 [Mucilaginibacter terrenus]